jgi:hypothetical protein
MWEALATVSPPAFTSTSADHSITNVSHGLAFVDNATVFLNDIGNLPMDKTTITVGAKPNHGKDCYTPTEAPTTIKMFYYIILWDWASGFPILRSKNKMTRPISITDSPSQQPVTITMKNYHKSERTLGIRIAPNGTQTTEIAWLTSKALTFATLAGPPH